MITTEFKQLVVKAVLAQRANFEGTDNAYSRKLGINNSVYSRLKNGELEGILKDAQWLNIGQELNVSLNERKWVFVETDVYLQIQEEVDYCQKYSRSISFVDDADIGKTVAGKQLSRSRKNCFYISGCQHKTKQQMIRAIAKELGVDSNCTYIKVKQNIKYALKAVVQKPVIIIDEAGDLTYEAFLEIKELWNATEGCCGWYMMGAEGFEEKIFRGIRNKKVGYREWFRRFANKFSKSVPFDRTEKRAFYEKLLTDVATANLNDSALVRKIVKKCLVEDNAGNMGGLTKVEDLIILHTAA